MPNLTDPGHGSPSELKAIAITIHILLTIVTILGNSLVITAFHKFSSLQSASNAILVSLSVADILMTVSFVLNIANIIVGKTTSRVLCSFASTVSLTFNAIIILHLALISVERFIAIKFALRYHTIVTNRRAKMMSLVVWLWGIAVVLIFPKVLKTDGLQAFEEFLQALSPCFDRHHQPFSLQSSSARLYLVFLVVSLLVVPIVIIMSSYSYIFKVAWKQRRQIRKEDNLQGELTMKREMKGARTAAIVVGVCLISFIPLLVVLCLRFLTSSPIKAPKIHAVYLVASFNASWNPLIYCWRNGNFRNSFKRLLRCKT